MMEPEEHAALGDARKKRIERAVWNTQHQPDPIIVPVVADPGYHVTQIKKGVIGQLSKVQEELDEAKDAEAQGVSVMLLVELSDLMGAVEAYLEDNFPELTLEDLIRMSDVTRRAFRSGHRK